MVSFPRANMTGKNILYCILVWALKLNTNEKNTKDKEATQVSLICFYSSIKCRSSSIQCVLGAQQSPIIRACGENNTLEQGQLLTGISKHP